MPAQKDGGALRGGAPRVVWFTSECDPRQVSARSVAADLIRGGHASHLVWNPVSAELIQVVPLTRAADLLTGTIGREGRVCAQIMVVGLARDPFTNGPIKGIEQIMCWLDSWGVHRRWPAGPPLPSPQSYHSDRSRRQWARGGHFGCSQVPRMERPDPGGVDIRRITGRDTPLAEIPRPRPLPVTETAQEANGLRFDHRMPGRPGPILAPAPASTPAPMSIRS